MPKKSNNVEETINMLRQMEELISQGQAVEVATRCLGICDVTYYRWKKEIGGMAAEQSHRLKELERENARLKRLVADLSLDNQITKEALKVK